MADGASTAPRPYWANEREAKTLIERCLERFSWHMAALKQSGRWYSMRSVLSTYYGSGTDGQRDSGGLRDTGDDGETTEFHTNQVRPVISSVMSLIVGQWPDVKPRAKNESAKFLAQARFARELHQGEEEKSSGKARIVDTVRGGLLASSWNLGHAWAPQDGKEWALDETGQPVYEGDVQAFVLPPWRCVWDFAAADESARKWVLFRRPVSRFDTAANLEETGRKDEAEKLRNVSEDRSIWARLVGGPAAKEFGDLRSLDTLLGEAPPDEDALWVWELRHLPTPALPAGRLVRFVEPDIVLWDSLAPGKDSEGVAYPYEELHVREYSPERVVAGSAGHTGAFDLTGWQEFIDLCTASMATTVNVNGQNRFWDGGGGGEGNTGANVRSLGINGAMIESPRKPEVLEFPALKAEVVKAADWGISGMNSTMALNEVVRGMPSKGMPAQAMALLKNTAVQYHAVAQGDFVRLVKWDANSRLRLLKRFARTKRVAELAGKSRAYELREWSREDIAGVAGFDVEQVNPGAMSFENLSAIGEMFVTKGLMSPEDYLTFVQTGNLEQGLQTKTAQKELVEANVELLHSGIGLPPVDMEQMKPLMEQWQAEANAAAAAGGEPPPKPLPIFAATQEGERVLRILKSDPHHIAIPAYLAVLSSPTSRDDAKLMKAATEATQLSLAYWQSLTPDEAACYGIPPLPSQAMAAMPPPGAPGEEKPSGPESGEGLPEEGAIEQPKDPSTGEAAMSSTPQA